MSDDPQGERRRAYLTELRALGRSARIAGFVASLVGVLMMVIARYRIDSPLLLYGGAAVVAVGWAFFIFALARRYLWIRAHPFDLNG
ncbi:MAG: hypothetical protein ACREEQ_13805 [Caulobacteraceae bacterium]